MAVWRRKALEFFPFLRHAFQQPDSTVYEVFFLLPHVSEVIASGDTELLQRMFAFAEWCAGQRTIDLWNAAGVVFYEHLFDGGNWQHRHEVVRWLSPRIIAEHMNLWEHWLSGPKFAEVKRLLLERLEGRDL
ncbi:MAG TPA: hypothetical protein VMF69_15200 [Gemmataceae bacterium]|nr:hypothetical protein [Gemmataceae bacterium]